MLKRIINNLQIRKRAIKFKVRFTLLRTFVVPHKILINNKWVDIMYPDEKGMWSAFVEIFLMDGYQLEFLKTKNIKTIVDVGANVGFFSMAARGFFPGANILAFEPNKNIEKYLRHNLKELNVKVHLEAVGRINSYVSLSMHDSESIMKSVVEDEHSTIKQTAFRDIADSITDRIDLLKLDCEGSEWSILEDAEAMKKVRYLAMEYHLHAREGSTVNDMKQVLEKCGFNIITVREDNGFGFILAVNKTETNSNN